MTILQYIASIAFLSLGGLIAAFNLWVLFRQMMGKPSPSGAPLLGGTLLFVGALLFPGGALRPYAVFGLFLDYGCMPYLVLFTISMIRESRRYAEKNRIFSLRFEAERCSGEIHLFPESECIYEYSASDGLERGSICMKVESYIPNSELKMSAHGTQIHLEKHANSWRLVSESGWHGPLHSLKNSSLTEMSTSKLMKRSLSGAANF